MLGRGHGLLWTVVHVVVDGSLHVTLSFIEAAISCVHSSLRIGKAFRQICFSEIAKKRRESTLQGRTHATCYCRLCHRILLKSFLGKEMAEQPVADCSVGICYAYNYVMKMPWFKRNDKLVGALLIIVRCSSFIFFIFNKIRKSHRNKPILECVNVGNNSALLCIKWSSPTLQFLTSLNKVCVTEQTESTYHDVINELEMWGQSACKLRPAGAVHGSLTNNKVT